MKKLLIAAALTVAFMASSAGASPLDDFRQNGQVGGFLDLDFAMQNEVNSAINASVLRLEDRYEAAVAGAASLAMMPDVDNALTMGAAIHGHGKALAVGYSKHFSEGKYVGKVGAAFDNESRTTFGMGFAYKF